MKRTLALLVFAAACAPPGAGAYQLTDAVRTYTEGVKWERFEAAAAVIPPRERDLFLDEREALADDLRITEAEVVRVADHGRTADVQVRLSWYRDSEGVVHESVAAQRWERQGKAWRLVDEHRARGDEMPGLRETTEVSERARSVAE